jgi:RimJ/RimL family protein N-acetyltransferase
MNAVAKLHEIKTPRLLLRQWRDSDLPSFIAMGQDLEVTKFFPKPLSVKESTEMADRCALLISERGWGFWAAEEVSSKLFIGFIGLHIPPVSMPCSPCVEIGWRLARPYWNQGLATEGAKVVLDFAFNTLELPEVVSFTALGNIRSEAVMKRLEMKRDAATFEHPFIPEGHFLREHCLYRKQRIAGNSGA